MTLAVGVEGACMNVLINLPGLNDNIAIKQYKNQVNDLLETVHALRDELLNLIYQIFFIMNHNKLILELFYRL